MRGFEPTRKYFFSIFILSCLLFVALTGALYRDWEISQKRQYFVNHTYDTLRQARNLLIESLNLETGQRGYLLSGDQAFLEPYHQAEQHLDDDIRVWINLTANDPAQQAQLSELSGLLTIVRNKLDTQIQNFTLNKKQPDATALESGRNAMNALRTYIEKLIHDQRQVQANQLRNLNDQQNRALLTLMVGAIVALSSLVLANLVIYVLLDRKRHAEADLHATEDRFTAVINGINDGIYDIDLKTHQAYFSPIYKRMLGYDDSDKLSNVDDALALIHPDDVDKCWSHFQNFLQSPENVYRNIFRMRHKDGNWHWILSRGVVTRENGEPQRIIGAHTDISQQKKYEEELRQLNTDMEGFVYIVSHDLRAPLINLKGFAGEIEHARATVRELVDPLRATLPQDAQTKLQTAYADMDEAIGFIRNSAERMDRLTSSILEISRIGGREYNYQTINPNDIVQRCLDTLAHEITNRQIKVQVLSIPSYLYTDAMAFEQIVANVLDNAVKYLQNDRPGEITISAVQLHGEIIFSVRDNGRGIAPNDTRKVFEIFRRAGNSADVRGTGLGMATVKATLRKMGGRIWFESELGVGSIFHFTLPMHAPEPLPPLGLVP